nr:peroxisomal acyl-coenzyme A oxidase 3-like [Onthophagus taurus]
MTFAHNKLTYHSHSEIFKKIKSNVAFIYFLSGGIVETMRNRIELLKDFPNGPLSGYRKSASFDWKKMMTFFYPEEVIKFMEDIYTEIYSNPDCHLSLKSRTFDEIRRDGYKYLNAFKRIKGFAPVHDNDHLNIAVNSILLNFDNGVTLKYLMAYFMVPLVIKSMGTEKHLEYAHDILNYKMIGTFCLTEIGHGTNTSGMRTTATYDVNTKEFVINTPDFEAAKCWSGNLGQSASIATLFAHLITPDGKNHGLHCFLVPLRCPKTLEPYTGIIIGDLGEKAGVNATDNGFVMFNNYRIPKDNLLNKYGDVTDDGEYVASNKGKETVLGSLTNMRMGVVFSSHLLLTKAITIAIRYGAVRRQFGPDGSKEELPIIEYQLHQHRLIPHIAVAYATKMLADKLYLEHSAWTKEALSGGSVPIILIMESHALSAAAKVVCSWSARDGIQECREACAGHGYLKASGISDIRNDHDPSVTYDGENHVLIQQASNVLMKFWPSILNRTELSSPLGSLDFLGTGMDIIAKKWIAKTVDDFNNLDHIIKIYEWINIYLIKSTYDRFQNFKNSGSDKFTAKNSSQVYYSRSLGIAYIQLFTLNLMKQNIIKVQDKPISLVLTKLAKLFGVYNLEKHFLSHLYQGGFASGPEPVTLIQETVLLLCKDLKSEAVALVDAIAPPDFLLRSVIGASNGQIYQNLENNILRTAGNMSKPTWWKEIVDRDYLKKNKL